MNALLGAYGDSDDEGSGEAAACSAPVASTGVAKASGGGAGAAGGGVAGEAAAAQRLQNGGSSPSAAARRKVPSASEAFVCESDEDRRLLARFVAKNLQTKGIRFKCRLCGEVIASKADAAFHFQIRHGQELQAFKREKAPKLLEDPKEAFKRSAPKISFAREDVLKKRVADEDKSFGGWTKKEKPEPPPCEQPGYQSELMSSSDPVLTAPPWQNATRPSDDDASQMDKEVDARIYQAQVKRFSVRNVLEVNPTTARCKLCFKVIGTAAECEKHIIEAHKDDFEKEMGVWERFLFTTCKRQPPFGWVCKVCGLFFPSDGAVWRHLGKEIFIRREERHTAAWHEKEDRWGHEEDQECNGDGMNVAGGLSYESVKRFNEAARREAEDMAAKESQPMGPANKPEDSDEEEAAEVPPEEVGKIQFINSF